MQRKNGNKKVRFAEDQVLNPFCSTIMPFSNDSSDKELCDQFCRNNCAEQSLTKKSSLYFMKNNDEVEEKVLSARTIIPFQSHIYIEMKSSLDWSQYYDKEFKYSLLFLGTFLYNQSVGVENQKYLPEQCYTKKSTLFCEKK